MNTTRPCSFFLAGDCKNGDKCHYSHDKKRNIPRESVQKTTIGNQLLTTGQSLLELLLEQTNLSNKDFMNLDCDLLVNIFDKTISQQKFNSLKEKSFKQVDEKEKSFKKLDKDKLFKKLDESNLISTKVKKEKFSKKKVTKVIYNHGEAEDIVIIENPPQNNGLLISGTYEIKIPLNEDGTHKFQNDELESVYYDDLLRILKEIKELEYFITMGGFFQKYKEYKKV